MKQIFNIIVLSYFINIINVSISVKTTKRKEVKTQDDALSWFNKFGYNPCLNTEVQCSLSLITMLKDYQERFGLAITGKLDETTKKHMNQPRCGNSDKPLSQTSALGISSISKWSRSSLTYSLRGNPTELSSTTTAAIIRKAFDAWLKHIPLTITEVCSTCKADFVLDFSRTDHQDSYPFDGVGGTLAHAFFPEDGRVHFDKDETWSKGYESSGTNLFLVAVHEIGHALGLDHTYDRSSIMYPSYQVIPEEKIIPEVDRRSIQTIYSSGKPSATTKSTTRSTTTTTTTTKSKITTQSYVTGASGMPHTRCQRFLDVAFNHPDGTFHTFSGGILWRYLPYDNSWEDLSNSYKYKYDNLPSQLSAGAYDSRKNDIVFFTSSYVYHYTVDHNNKAQYQTNERLPRNLRNSIVGAIYYRGSIHVVTPKTIRTFELDNNYQFSDERDLSTEFPRFSGSLVTAFSYNDLHHFFTRDRRVYVWSEQLNSWKTFNKPMETGWFSCPGSSAYNTGENDNDSEKQPNRKDRNRSPQHRHHHHQHRHY